MAVPWADDALWAGARIAERLRVHVPSLRQVLEIDEYDPAVTEPTQAPSAVVTWGAMRPTSSMGRSALVAQQWLVVLYVRRVQRRRPTEHEPNNAAAGALITQTVRALHGWAPEPNARTLDWTGTLRPHRTPNGTFVPLMFNLQVLAT